jgi:uncharacterized membrane protein YraQ (UPF0718 family)
VESSRWKRAARGLLNNIKMSIPILVGVLLLVGALNTFVPKEFFARIFTGNTVLDPLIGALFGSIAAGNPLTSYIIGGELLNSGISLLMAIAIALLTVLISGIFE